MNNLSLLLVKHPLKKAEEIEISVLEYLKENGFKIIKEKYIPDVLKTSLKIYQGVHC